MTADDYLTVIWTSAAEFPGYLATALLIDRVGRKKSIFLLSLISVVCTFSLVKCSDMSRAVIVALLFCSRGTIAGWMQVLFVYTPEVYATKLRSLAMGEI